MTTPLTVRLGGTTWLQQVGGYTDVAMSHAWPHGSEELSWTMDLTTFHPLLAKGGTRVEGFAGGVRRFLGRLSEPAADGHYSANGSWSEAAGVYALDSGGDATIQPDEAIDQAIARGAVSWSKPVSLSSSDWAGGTTDEPMRLTDLLDGWAEGAGLRWYVDANGVVGAAADPTTPKWVVPSVFAGRGLTLADDDYYSHLIIKYFTTGPAFKTVTVGDSAAAAEFGYREAIVDLTPLGVLADLDAAGQASSRLALSGARLGFAENLTLGRGQITTLGGTPCDLVDPTAGDMVRLMGVQDRTRVGGSVSYLDLVIGRSQYAEGSPTVLLTPVGKARRDLTEILAS